MTEVIIIWAICGALGAGLLLRTLFVDEPRVKRGDVALAALFSLAGPFMLLVGLMMWFQSDEWSKPVWTRRR